MNALSTRADNASSVNAGSGWKSKKVYTVEEYEACYDGERELQKWYARHNGLVLLSKENIERYCNYV